MHRLYGDTTCHSIELKMSGLTLRLRVLTQGEGSVGPFIIWIMYPKGLETMP